MSVYFLLTLPIQAGAGDDREYINVKNAGRSEYSESHFDGQAPVQPGALSVELSFGSSLIPSIPASVDPSPSANDPSCGSKKLPAYKKKKNQKAKDINKFFHHKVEYHWSDDPGLANICKA
ncbi:hypothetical protein SERLA73DRAFT_68144 [Serpula lacrymans var. lacrymans S7.3]|uniref:Uncharacterized protein n=1 Tax=Serpula lacrymans var. lacrymans (strain S7.3) TaxID=936435 RepID=F8PH73_SERL3|nr:hypothetical protein SERLA73DRAFT_68144 [Serpula lacrymans var. lacrymans S7.3]